MLDLPAECLEAAWSKVAGAVAHADKATARHPADKTAEVLLGSGRCFIIDHQLSSYFPCVDR